MDNMSIDELAAGVCRCLPRGTPVLPAERVRQLLALLPGWLERDGGIQKTFRRDNYFQTMALVNAVAVIAHRADHHPEITFGYRQCTVRYTTHSIGGLSENDFICAARVEKEVGA